MSSEQQKKFMDEALFEQQLQEGRDAEAWPSLLTIVGFVFLTFNCAIAVCQWTKGLEAISFLGFSFLDLFALFYCLRLYIKTAPGLPRREHLKMALWLLTTLLTIGGFSLLYQFNDPVHAEDQGEAWQPNMLDGAKSQ